MLDQVNFLDFETQRYKEALENYLHMDHRIKQVRADKQRLIDHYHEQPLIHSTWNFDSNGMKVCYTSLEARVINYVDTCAEFDDLAESLIARGKLFSKWLKTLTRHARGILGQGIDLELDQLACKKVSEIERTVPVKYRF